MKWPKCKTLNLLEENIGSASQNIGVGIKRDFLNGSSSAPKLRSTVDK